ncbi:nuclear transport factor 2 family protein [Nocardia sp. NPDC056100]|uniref:nuclear transport factor 2 family protein n=1 Tax=Nocardia sp. NPDC056100 TaxID=3345712 RepID=UPI0035E023A8
MSTAVETPRELVERLFNGLPDRNPDAFAALMAPDAVFEIPFTIPGMQTRFEGRDEIREHLARWWSGSVTEVQVHAIDAAIYETTDPGLFFVENDVELTRKGEPRVRVRTSVNVVRVRDGQVVLFRDYMDTARLLALSGRLREQV